MVRGVHLLVEVRGVPLEPGVKIGRIGVGQGRSAASEAKIVWDRAETGLLNMLLQHLLLAVRVELHAQGGLVNEFRCLFKQSRHQCCGVEAWHSSVRVHLRPVFVYGSIVRIWYLPHETRAEKNRRIDRHINSHTVVGLALVVGHLNLLAEVHGHGRRSDAVSLPLAHSKGWGLGVDGTKDGSGANEDEGAEVRGAVPRLLVKIGN